VKPRVTSGGRRLPERARLAAALEALPEMDRLVLSLRLIEGLSTLETAGALRVKADEVEKRMASALLKLSPQTGVRPASRRAA
jgi:DNA-directed RNA polymerase specialized sigma24 family protein